METYLTESELDQLTEIQINLPDAELDTAIAELRPEALMALLRQSLVMAAKQTDIAKRAKSALRAQGIVL